MKNMPPSFRKGFTLIELMVAVSVFAMVMMLASGAYLVMLDTSQRAQASATGIDNLAFALTTMTRTIRTGTQYNCNTPTGGDCNSGATLYFTDQNGDKIEYSLPPSSGTIYESINGGAPTPLTEPSVQVQNLTFVVNGTATSTGANIDTVQPYVFITVSGDTSAGPGNLVPFAVQTSAVMRGTDL